MGKKHIIKYTFIRMCREYKVLLIMSVPIVLIIALFILGFTAYQESSTKSFQNFFSGMDNKTIVFDTQHLKESEISKLNDKQIFAHHDGYRLNFSDSDYAEINKIEGVKVSALTLSSVKSTYDKDGFSLNKLLTKEEVSEEVRTYFKNDNQTLTLNFEALTVPENIIKHYNMEEITLKEGRFPKDGSNEILVPDFYAESILNGEKKIKNIIGEKIFLPVRDINTDKKREEVNIEYRISGVFVSKIEYVLNLEYPIYVSYFPQHQENDSNFLDESYNYFYSLYSENKQTLDYSENIIKDKSSFEKALGTGYDQIIVVTESEKDAVEVQEKLQKLYPKYHFVSQYDLKHGELSDVYRSLKRVLVIGSLLISLIMGIIIIFINKGYVSNRNYELSILYSQGFSRKNILTNIIFESVTIYTIYLTLAYIIDLFLKEIVFNNTRYYWMFENLFDVNNIVAINLLISITVIISIVWGIRGINKNNLIKHLNK